MYYNTYNMYNVYNNEKNFIINYNVFQQYRNCHKVNCFYISYMKKNCFQHTRYYYSNIIYIKDY